MRPNISNGTFLLRPSSSVKCFALSVRFNDEILHYKVHIMADGFSCFIGKPCLIHASIRGLLKYHHDKPIVDEECLYLKHPFSITPTSVNEMVIPSSKVELLDEIGDGNYAIVRKGLFNGVDVAVKIMKIKTKFNQNVLKPKENLLKEADKMRRFFHPNLCLLIGVALDTIPAFLVMEYLNKGSLESCLRDDGFVHQQVTLDFVTLCLKKVACGMKYLSQQKPPVLHRDLRAANVLLDEKKGNEFEFKITDFGLTEILQDGSNSFKQQTNENAQLPTCWLAPEAVGEEKTFSVKSDVWSFGILAFEIFSLGTNPILFLGPSRDVEENIKKGKKKLTFENCTKDRRPVKDFEREICPEFLFWEIEKCWKYNPIERPTFDALYDYLDNLFHI